MANVTRVAPKSFGYTKAYYNVEEILEILLLSRIYGLVRQRSATRAHLPQVARMPRNLDAFRSIQPQRIMIEMADK
jgi:hypothetical protein